MAAVQSKVSVLIFVTGHLHTQYPCIGLQPESYTGLTLFDPRGRSQRIKGNCRENATGGI